MQAEELLKKYLDGKCTAEEIAIVESWYNKQQVATPKPLTDEEQEKDIAAIISFLDNRHHAAEVKTRFWPKILLAASVLLILSTGSYFYLNQRENNFFNARNLKNDVQPGGNKATLALADGSKIVLDNHKNGVLINNGNVIIDKKQDGELAYKVVVNEASTAVTYNTLATPKGGVYQLELPDGTKVWLNAASSLKFPTAFNGKERNVELSGEAYFEVAKNKEKPFHVLSGRQVIEVLGTHFNVNAYADESGIKTTLLEGAVKVSGQETSNEEFLHPGQQSVFNTDASISVSTVNTDDAIAWKNGLFSFHNASLQTILKQFARWYNVDVVYDGQIPDRKFSGNIYRNLTALQALDLLSYTKVHFRIEAGNGQKKKIVVNP